MKTSDSEIAPAKSSLAARGSQILLAVSCVVLAMTLTAQWVPPLLSVPPGAQVRCQEPVWNAGKVFHGQSVEGEFVIENTGRTAVTVRKVSASCGCTTVRDELEGRRIEAGSKFTIPVTWTVSSEPGKQSKSVSVQFDEWPNWTMPLRIDGEILPSWTLTPPQLSLGTLTPDAEIQREVRLTFTEGSPIHSVKSVQCSNRNLRIVLEPANDGPGHRVVVHTIAPLPLGRLAANVYLHTDGDSISLPVVGFVEGTLSSDADNATPSP